MMARTKEGPKLQGKRRPILRNLKKYPPVKSPPAKLDHLIFVDDYFLFANQETIEEQWKETFHYWYEMKLLVIESDDESED